MTWPPLTPLEFSALCAATAVLLIGVTAGLCWVIFRWLPRKFDEAADKSIAGHVAAAEEICLYCRGLAWTADCTCPKRCTAAVCMAPVKAVKGPAQ